MKNLKFFALAIAIIGFSSTSFAVSNVYATIKANIVTQIVIEKNEDLKFGNIAPSATVAGTVTLSTDGTRTNSGASLSTVAGTVSAAQFTVTAFAGSRYALTLPANGAVKLTGPGTAMSLTAFTSTAVSGTLGDIPSGGSQVINVGATLNIGVNQAPGAYTASFNVTVAYN